MNRTTRRPIARRTRSLGLGASLALALALSGCITDSESTPNDAGAGGEGGAGGAGGEGGAGGQGGAGAVGGAGGGGAGGVGGGEGGAGGEGGGIGGSGGEGGAGGVGGQGGEGGGIGGSGGEGGAGGVGGAGGEGGGIGGAGGSGGEPCDEIPACPPNAVNVVQCPPDAPCVSFEACGQLVNCMEVGPCADVDPCNFNEVRVPYCPFEAERRGECRTTHDCGQLAFCAIALDCDAAPFCPAGTHPAPDCQPGDASCHWEMVCSEVIACRADDPCQCLPNTYPAEAPCAPSDAFCVPRTMCLGEPGAAAPGCFRQACAQRANLDACREGWREVPACADNGHACNEDIACGLPYICESPVSCINPCPEGVAQVDACSGDDQFTCTEVPECGVFCEGPAR